ncbi:uncharacterized protein K444DRAFT_511115, partial [Hyaloscypha bicolor E]
KTAFRTYYSYFKYLIISFGLVFPFILANILAIFQIYINTIFIGLLNYFIVIYL